MDPKGISAEGRKTEIPILSADNRPMFCFAIFFAIFDFFSFWQSQKFSELHKNVFFRSNFLWTSQNSQNLKIAKYFLCNFVFFFVFFCWISVFFCRKSGGASAEGRSRDPQILQNIKNTGKYQPKNNQIIFLVI